MSYRPWRIALTVVVDREAYNEHFAMQQAREVIREIRKNVGGAVQEIEVLHVEEVERRTGHDRRETTR